MFEGFAKDLAEAMASRLRTKYRIREVATFGEKNKDTNQWDGLIGELVMGRADMAICDLTITVRSYQRSLLGLFTHKIRLD